MKTAKPSLASSPRVPADFGRHQAVVATESAAAVFRGFETIRKIQEDAAHRASKRHADAASRLRGNCSPAEIMAVQSDLLRSDVEAASQYWQGITAAALEMQAQVIDCAMHLFDTEAILAGTAAVDAAESRIPGLEALLAMFPLPGKPNGQAYGPRAEAS